MRMIANLALALVVVCSVTPCLAQGREVRLDGRVQWIAGEKMMLIPRSGGVPVNIDLTQVPQERYAALVPGTLVVVDGLVSSDGRRMIATSIATEPTPEEQVTFRQPSRW
ncbi:MAG: hypothetical protein C5B48_11465 [Candidatus Rokuibacteriota bacterium]|nr:MAG: hypothetical protein C5B48_11465 [Candidatus Rokubacteria bacterium]